MAWILLIILVVFLLCFDLFILHKKGKLITNQKAAIETIFWISIAALFSLAIYWVYQNNQINNPNHLSASKAVVKYVTGYLIELSLSIDNLFVIAIIFQSFNIPIKYQHRTLFWGILGAIVFRGIMIGVGVILINKINWLTYIFGIFLMYTAFKILLKKERKENKSLSDKLGRFFNLSDDLDGNKFWTIKNGIKMGTPLFAALIIIELTDLLFAIDSIPAVLAITTDPFIVFSSNIFAILGLRSMYFFLANMLKRFHYLKYSVFTILVFVSIKLMAIHYYHFPEWFSLSFIGIAILTGILFSIHKNKLKLSPVKVKSR